MITTQPMRIAAYCQTPTPDNDSIIYQKIVISRTLIQCADLPPKITVYADDGYCPENDIRPGFQRLLQDAAANRFDAVAVCDWSQLATTQTGVMRLRRFFEMNRVYVAECCQPTPFLRIAV